MHRLLVPLARWVVAQYRRPHPQTMWASCQTVCPEYVLVELVVAQQQRVQLLPRAAQRPPTFPPELQLVRCKALQRTSRLTRPSSRVPRVLRLSVQLEPARANRRLLLGHRRRTLPRALLILARLPIPPRLAPRLTPAALQHLLRGWRLQMRWQMQPRTRAMMQKMAMRCCSAAARLESAAAAGAINVSQWAIEPTLAFLFLGVPPGSAAT
mmetsp:Transcript_11520/g.40227  ORF Transcript_11520/g.40227 Transcript_11520/m.40227 type:complete len:211 (+) Transcript_11520:5157-5789(+)